MADTEEHDHTGLACAMCAAGADDTADERWAAYFLRVEDLIAANGYTCQGVFPTEPDGEHFGYTIGRAAQGLPEIIVMGFSSTAQTPLDMACSMWDHVGGPTVGVVYPLAMGEGAVCFAPVPDEQVRERLTVAVRRHRRIHHLAGLQAPPLVAWQFLFTDDEGRWPWDPERQAADRAAGRIPQSLLAGADWRPE